MGIRVARAFFYVQQYLAHGSLPSSGGLHDQAASFLALYRVVMEEKGHLDRLEADARKREQMRAAARVK